jgi:hypothetical protein
MNPNGQWTQEEASMLLLLAVQFPVASCQLPVLSGNPDWTLETGDWKLV